MWGEKNGLIVYSLPHSLNSRQPLCSLAARDNTLQIVSHWSVGLGEESWRGVAFWYVCFSPSVYWQGTERPDASARHGKWKEGIRAERTFHLVCLPGTTSVDPVWGHLLRVLIKPAVWLPRASPNWTHVEDPQRQYAEIPCAFHVHGPKFLLLKATM